MSSPRHRPFAGFQHVVPFLSGGGSTLSGRQRHWLEMHMQSAIPRVSGRLSALLHRAAEVTLDGVHASDDNPASRPSSGGRGAEAAPVMLIFNAPPLPGTGVVGMPRGLAIALAEGMLGSRRVGSDRPLREVELALLYQAATGLLEEILSNWKPVVRSSPRVLGHEIEERYLPAAITGARSIEVAMTVQSGDAARPLWLRLPLEFVVPVMDAELDAVTPGVPPPEEPAEPRWNDAFGDIPVRVSARVASLELTPRQIASIRPGDVLPLPADSIEDVVLTVGGIERFAGRLGSAQRRVAVEIVRRIPTEARLQA